MATSDHQSNDNDSTRRKEQVSFCQDVSIICITPLKLITQLIIWFCICGILGPFATRPVIQNRSGFTVPLWLLSIWCTPLIASIRVLSTIQKPKSR